MLDHYIVGDARHLPTILSITIGKQVLSYTFVKPAKTLIVLEGTGARIVRSGLREDGSILMATE